VGSAGHVHTVGAPHQTENRHYVRHYYGFLGIYQILFLDSDRLPYFLQPLNAAPELSVRLDAGK
jgi:hypothetical protein